ncbi:MAG: hypothetical protein HY908_32120, partial [Myxococcales bacterium]|nr:hypothetical protein [Myxococcales bacterium]
PVAAARPAVPVLPPLALDLAVAELDGVPVASEAWLARVLAEAERLMAPHGVHLAPPRRRALAARFARLETAADRDALAAELAPGALQVFVVRTLRDVDDPRLERQGVRWRLLRDLRKSYVILSTAAMPTTLAHELGHALGNPHSQVPNNVMSYERDDPALIAFDASQGARMRAVARQLLATWQVLARAAAR